MVRTNAESKAAWTVASKVPRKNPLANFFSKLPTKDKNEDMEVDDENGDEEVVQMKGIGKGNRKGKSSNKKEAEVDENDDPNKEKSNKLTGEKSIDWSLIKIWCCGKFFSSVDIDAHAELCHTGGSFGPGVLQDESAEFPQKSTKSTEISAEEGKIVSPVPQAEYWRKKRTSSVDTLLMCKAKRVKKIVGAEKQVRKKTLRNGSASKTFQSHKEVNDERTKKGRKICSVCGKSFGYNSELNMHMRVHTGEKPFLCLYCPKKFTTKGLLDQHTRIHTGEKPFQCLVCYKRFTQLSNLKVHKKKCSMRG